MSKLEVRTTSISPFSSVILIDGVKIDKVRDLVLHLGMDNPNSVTIEFYPDVIVVDAQVEVKTTVVPPLATTSAEWAALPDRWNMPEPTPEELAVKDKDEDD